MSCQESCFTCHVSCDKCHAYFVMCHVLCVTYHMPPLHFSCNPIWKHIEYVEYLIKVCISLREGEICPLTHFWNCQGDQIKSLLIYIFPLNNRTAKYLELLPLTKILPSILILRMQQKNKYTIIPKQKYYAFQ